MSSIRVATVGLALALATIFPAAGQDAARPPPGGSQDTLRIPGFPPVPMPPGAHVYRPQDNSAGHQPPGEPRAYQNRSPGLPSTVIGPPGVVKPFPRSSQDARQKPPPKKVLTPEEKASQVRKALAPKPPLAIVRRKTLETLYAKLAVARDEPEAKGLATMIGSIWMRSGSDTADLLMQRAMQAIDKKTYPVALDLLDRLVALRPGWAEAWNKRASVHFYTKDYDGAMSDVEHVLKLEPKHFGALDGMAAILQRTGFDKRALEIYRRSLAIYPHQPEVEKIVDKLTLEVEGRGI